MKLSAFCINRRVTTIMAYIMIVVFGILGFTNLSLDLMPDVEIPMAVVYTVYPNAGPKEVESMVTKPLEGAASSVQGIDTVNSTSSENMSMIMIAFVDGTDMDQAAMDLREKIDMIKGSLPDDCNAPTIMKIDPDAMPVIQYGIKGDELHKLQSFAEDTITPRLERIDGVASIDIYGGYEQEISVKTDTSRLRGYNISVDYVGQMLGAQNISIPSGDVQSGTKTLNVRTDGEFKSVDDIKNMLIPLPTGGSVRLSEIAEVSEDYKSIDTIAKLNGEDCIAVSVNKQSGVNTVKVAESVEKEMQKILSEATHLESSALLDQSEYINLSVNAVLSNILLGIVLAAIVIFVFLRNIGATTVISLSMPICIIVTFLLMQAMDLTMNLMSLGGMAMGVGMIVDNSIVVLENIFKFRDDGKNRYEACTQGASEVALSITASTLTTIAVFLPIGLSGGMTGMMFREFSLTIASLLIASLLIALTLVPLLCYMLMDRKPKKTSKLKQKLFKAKKEKEPKEPKESKKKPVKDKTFAFTKSYQALLRKALKHRRISVGISVLMVVLAFILIAGSAFELIPTMDQSVVSVSVKMPIGSEVEESAQMADQVIAVASEIPEVESLFYSAENESASITINLVPINQRDRSTEEIGNFLRSATEDIAGAEISVDASGGTGMGAMSGDAISVKVTGDDYNTLDEISRDLANQIGAIPGTIEVKSSAGEQIPQVEISIKTENASRFGLTAATIGQAVRGQLSGVTSTKLSMNGDEIDVVVKGDSSISGSVDALRSMPIPLQSGGSVPLSIVANVDTVLAPTSYTRENQTRTLSITGGVSGVTATDVAPQVQKIIDEYPMPEGYNASAGGEMEDIIETFTSLAYALIVAIGLVYFILASQFESFVMPFIIMLIMPIGLIGGLCGLPIFGLAISMPAFIGVIMLAGIVVNSSIVLIDYINTRRKAGEDTTTAIVNACPRRVRPVIMTTLTTILGLLPMAMGIGEGSEMMMPMAIVMIAGMVISTIVTLIFTPVFYAVITKNK